jgi:integrase
MGLSELGIKALKPRSKRYQVTDSRGLSIEVFPTGGLAWRYRYQFEGKTQKLAMGKYPQVSLKAARQKRDGYAVMIANGQSPAEEKRLGKVALAAASTLQDFGERYYKEVVLKDLKNPKSIRRYLDKELYPVLGSKSLRSITAADVQAIVFRKRDNGFEAAAAAIRNLVKRIFDYALVCGAAQINPALALPTRFITRARPRTRALSPEEIREYLTKLYRSNIRRQFKLSLHIILLTLVRKSELRLAFWKDVDLETAEWLIPASVSKTGKPHTVYLSRQVVTMFEELQALAGTSELVLPGRGSLTRPFAGNAMNQALNSIHFAIEPFTIHDLRRTGSTLLHEQGFPTDVVEKALNHTIGGVRGIYNRAAYADQRREMLQRWADYIDTIHLGD